MDQDPANQNQEKQKRRSLTDLLIWLALIPFILGTLLCCGQLALILLPGQLSTNTGSRLSADYEKWAYESIAPIDVERLIRDIEKEQRLYETGVPGGPIIDGVYWQPPTPPVEIGQITPSAVATRPAITSTLPAASPTPTLRTPISSPTNTLPAATATRTPTALPTVANTFTFTPTASRTSPPPPPPPTATLTEVPNEPTNTPRTPTNTPITPTTTPITPTVTPVTPQPPTETPTPTPTYAPVRPIAENGGVAEPVTGGGCRAFFGYRNDNPQEVDIAYGDQNWIDDPVATDNPPQPTHFLIGREFQVFEFTWYTGVPLTWWLDGRSAVAAWCNPAP